MKKVIVLLLLYCANNTLGMGHHLIDLIQNQKDAQDAQHIHESDDNDLDEKPSVDPTVVLIKACKGRPTSELITWLIGRGANVNEVHDNEVHDKTTALLTAIDNEQANEMVAIINQLASHATDAHKAIALRHATEQEKWEAMQALQTVGAQISEDDIYQPDMLDHAVSTVSGWFKKAREVGIETLRAVGNGVQAIPLGAAQENDAMCQDNPPHSDDNDLYPTQQAAHPGPCIMQRPQAKKEQ